MANNSLLEVENLAVQFPGRSGPIDAVRGVSFSMGREKIGIVGESGSGKSMTGRAILGLLAPTAKMSADRLCFDGGDLLALRQKQRRALLGRRISMILQDPKYSLNPVMRVVDQLEEACRARGWHNAEDNLQRITDILRAVRIEDTERVLQAYPHELSGGMAQRVMIAMMILPGPDLLIADEPTSALDVTVRLQVLAILDELVSARGMGLILISHDLDLVANFCDRILVMYAGRIVESCVASELDQARHPYTRGLLQCRPSMAGRRRELPVLMRDAAWREHVI